MCLAKVKICKYQKLFWVALFSIFFFYLICNTNMHTCKKKQGLLLDKKLSTIQRIYANRNCFYDWCLEIIVLQFFVSCKWWQKVSCFLCKWNMRNISVFFSIILSTYRAKRSITTLCFSFKYLIWCTQWNILVWKSPSDKNVNLLVLMPSLVTNILKIFFLLPPILNQWFIWDTY